MKLQYRVGTAVASSALMLQLLAPAAFADTTVAITDNGKDSDNSVNVTNNHTSNNTQKNTFTVNLGISAKAKTGGNKANNNTGGDVDISTGKADATVNVTVNGGSNTMEVTSCPCDTDDKVSIKDNGADSTNTSNVTNKSNNTAKQTNDAKVKAKKLKAKAKTGKNVANGNTNGTTNVTTDDATSEVIVDVTAPDNTLTITP